MIRYGTNDLWTSLVVASKESINLIYVLAQKIQGGLQGAEEVEVSSVVKITAISADTVKMGNEWFFNFLAFLSLNLAFLNLLPFPALDGGRLIFLGVEAISRKPVPPRLEAVLHGFGVLILIFLMIWITAKDILSLL